MRRMNYSINKEPKNILVDTDTFLNGEVSDTYNINITEDGYYRLTISCELQEGQGGDVELHFPNACVLLLGNSIDSGNYSTSNNCETGGLCNVRDTEDDLDEVSYDIYLNTGSNINAQEWVLYIYVRDGFVHIAEDNIM